MKTLSYLLLVFAILPCIALAQLLNQSEPLPGVTSSGQPDAAELAGLAEKGFVAVIDLRGESEDRGFNESSVVEELGMQYVSIPMSGSEAVNYDNAATLDSILKTAGGPVLVHCASGNRAGALLSLRQMLIGEDADSALATGIAGGLTSPALREVVESKLSER
jgi:uncharacterized protein (TIGR01244 family)